MCSDEVRVRSECGDQMAEVIWTIGCSATGPCRIAERIVLVGLGAGRVEAGGCVRVAAEVCVSVCWGSGGLWFTYKAKIALMPSQPFQTLGS